MVGDNDDDTDDDDDDDDDVDDDCRLGLDEFQNCYKTKLVTFIPM